MRMYSFQSTCVEMDWGGIKLNSIPFHSNTCGLRWIHMYPKRPWVDYAQDRSTCKFWHKKIRHCIFYLNEYTWYNEDIGSFLGSVLIDGGIIWIIVSVSSSISIMLCIVGLLCGSWSQQLRAISMHFFSSLQSSSNDSCHCKVQTYSKDDSICML